MAEKNGVFEKMCLDVDLKATFSTANYPLVAANEAQFAERGVLRRGGEHGRQRHVPRRGGRRRQDGHRLADRQGGPGDDLADLKGKTIGVKGMIPPSVKAMLAQAGLVEGKDYTTVGIEGFDPLVHIAARPGGVPRLQVRRAA